MSFVSSRAAGWACLLALPAALLVGLAMPPVRAAEEPEKFTDEFRLGDCQWSSTGRNTYFVSDRASRRTAHQSPLEFGRSVASVGGVT